MCDGVEQHISICASIVIGIECYKRHDVHEHTLCACGTCGAHAFTCMRCVHVCCGQESEMHTWQNTTSHMHMTCTEIRSQQAQMQSYHMANTHTHTHLHMRAYLCADTTRTYAHAYSHTHTRTRTRIHIRMRTRARIYTHTHTHTHMHMHTCAHACVRSTTRIRTCTPLHAYTRILAPRTFLLVGILSQFLEILFRQSYPLLIDGLIRMFILVFILCVSLLFMRLIIVLI